MPTSSLDDLTRSLQSFFSDGLVVVVGSGLSIAEGIPGMGGLGVHLKKEIPRGLNPTDLSEWQKVKDELDKGSGVETALQSANVSDSLDEEIRKCTASFISSHEAAVVNDILQGKRSLRFGRILPHLNPQPNRALPVVTTNYDRLIEVAAELSGFGANKLFLGHYAGALDVELSRKSFIKQIVPSSKNVRLIYRPRIELYKPHGSLGWYDIDGRPAQCELSLNLPQFIITPGLTKYRRGYSVPFDKHRDEANKQIDKASRFLVLGYGFNDDHLETHLSTQIQKGKPCLLLTHGLSQNATDLLKRAPNMTALSYHVDGFVASDSNGDKVFTGRALWDVEVFVQEVLNP